MEWEIGMRKSEISATQMTEDRVYDCRMRIVECGFEEMKTVDKRQNQMDRRRLKLIRKLLTEIVLQQQAL